MRARRLARCLAIDVYTQRGWRPPRPVPTPCRWMRLSVQGKYWRVGGELDFFCREFDVICPKLTTLATQKPKALHHNAIFQLMLVKAKVRTRRSGRVINQARETNGQMEEQFMLHVCAPLGYVRGGGDEARYPMIYVYARPRAPSPCAGL
jgi:hypothetical protein